MASKTKDAKEAKESNGVVAEETASDLESGSGSELRVRTAILLLLLIFVSSLSALLFVYYSFPKLDQ